MSKLALIFVKLFKAYLVSTIIQTYLVTIIGGHHFRVEDRSKFGRLSPNQFFVPVMDFDVLVTDFQAKIIRNLPRGTT